MVQFTTNSTLFVGKNVITLAEIDSTNDYAKIAMSNFKPLPEGTVILAVNQYDGRGQRQNKWQSEPGKNLAASIVLKPTFLNAEQQFCLSMAISLGVADAVQGFLEKEVKVKWPNDIYVDDKKIAGILIESSLSGSVIKTAIVGIGLNVNQQQFLDLPQASSMAMLSDKQYDLQEIFNALCVGVEGFYLQLRQGQEDAILKAYLNRLLGMGEKRLFRRKVELLEGEIVGVGKTGKLQVNIAGKTESFAHKEIGFVF